MAELFDPNKHTRTSGFDDGIYQCSHKGCNNPISEVAEVRVSFLDEDDDLVLTLQVCSDPVCMEIVMDFLKENAELVILNRAEAAGTA